MKTEKISKLIDNAEVIRGEICEGFRKRIEELYSSLKDKKMVFGWQDVVLPYPNEDDYETEEDYDEAMEHYEEYSEGIINFTWQDDYNYCLLGGLSFRIIDGEVIFTSVINKSDEVSPEYSEDDYYFNPYLSDNFKCCAQIIKTIEAVSNNAFDCDKKTIMTEKIIEGIKYLLEEETLTAEVIKNPNGYRGNIIIPETIVFNEVTYRVTSVGKQAFFNCFSLTSVVIPNSVTRIGRDAFGGCDSLKSIVISNGVTSIGEAAFMECDSLNSIVIPNSVISIEDNAFSGCSSLTSIVIPESVKSIGEGAFSGCSSLTSVVVAEGNTVYDSREQCNAIIETETNKLISVCKKTIIPDGVTSIGSVFSQCESLTSITIPDSVTSIEEEAFLSCVALKSVVIGNGVTSIGAAAFMGCDSLKSITFNGTKIQWNSIELGDEWNCEIPAQIVRCTDGHVKIEDCD